MKPKFNFLLLLTFIIFSSCKTKKLYTEEMKVELKRMYNEDQDIQNTLISYIDQKKSKDKIDSIYTKEKKIFDVNYKTVLSYFNDYGFPGIKESDKFSSYAFWLIVQHCDHDVKFQNRVLSQIKKHVKKNNVNLQNYAFLYDRVKKNQGKEQLYGTQMVRDLSNHYIPYKLKDAKNVNKRRKEVGLKTIEEYLSQFQN